MPKFWWNTTQLALEVKASFLNDPKDIFSFINIQYIEIRVEICEEIINLKNIFWWAHLTLHDHSNNYGLVYQTFVLQVAALPFKKTYWELEQRSALSDQYLKILEGFISKGKWNIHDHSWLLSILNVLSTIEMLSVTFFPA